MKLVVKYNLWKYAENEKMSQPENILCVLYFIDKSYLIHYIPR